MSQQLERRDGGRVDLVEVPVQRIGRGRLRQQDLGEALNDRQLVLEIVPGLLDVARNRGRQQPRRGDGRSRRLFGQTRAAVIEIEPVIASETACRRAAALHGFSRKASWRSSTDNGFSLNS